MDQVQSLQGSYMYRQSYLLTSQDRSAKSYRVNFGMVQLEARDVTEGYLLDLHQNFGMTIFLLSGHV